MIYGLPLKGKVKPRVMEYVLAAMINPKTVTRDALTGSLVCLFTSDCFCPEISYQRLLSRCLDLLTPDALLPNASQLVTLPPDAWHMSS